MFMWLCNGRCLEFFEGEDGRLSMTRLLMFLSFWPSSFVALVCADKPNVSDVLMWYIGGYVLGYVGGKGADVFMSRRGETVERAERTTTVTTKAETKKPASDKED